MENEAKAKTEKVLDRGAALARDAINEIDVGHHPKETDTYRSAGAFIDECRSTDRDPMDVVSHIAQREDISLSGEAPEDPRKRETYELLRAVIRHLVNDVAEDLEGDAGVDPSKVQDMVLKTIGIGKCGNCYRKCYHTCRRPRHFMFPFFFRHGFAF